MRKIIKAIKDASAGLILSFALGFLAFIYAPFELYITNISEFWMKASQLAPALILLFSVCFFVFSALFVVSRLINKKLYRFNLAWVGALLIGFYIQGNFLVANLPPMGGETINWADYTAERIKSIIAFSAPFVVLLVLCIALKKGLFEKLVKITSICLSLLLAVTLTTLFVTSDTHKTENLVPTVKNEFQLSDNQNLIIFIVDAVDSGYFKNELEKDSELKNELDGFTYFDNALAAYPYTSHAVPMIFSGEWYENDSSFSDYLIRSVDKSPFINALEKNDYSIGIYKQSGLELDKDIFEGRFDNCFNSKISYKSKFLYQTILKMAGLKYAPWDFKKDCINISEVVGRSRIPSTDDKQFIWSNVAFYKNIKDVNAIETTDKKCARIIHIEGAHVPYKYDKDVNRIDSKKGSYVQNVQACTTIVKQYVKRLKESGVYDNSAIVILGDHGYAGNNKYDEYNIKKRMNPVVLVKGVDERHDMKYSSAPISYVDLTQAFIRLSEKKSSDEIFDWKENDSRTRRMLLFVYNKEEYMKEFITDGRADDPDAMKATGKEFNLKK